MAALAQLLQWRRDKVEIVAEITCINGALYQYMYLQNVDIAPGTTKTLTVEVTAGGSAFTSNGVIKILAERINRKTERLADCKELCLNATSRR